MSSPGAIIARIWRHPFNRGRRLRAIGRFVWWQLTAPIGGNPKRFRFVNDTVVNAHRGEAAVTGCLYCGLYEYTEMLFFLRVLRSGDLFIDVGANSGVYSLLAATAGAQVQAFEPQHQAYRRLLANIALNRSTAIRAHRLGVSRRDGKMAITNDRDSENFLIDAAVGRSEAVHVVALDTFSFPSAGWRFCKVDIEGHEMEMLAGAVGFLSDPHLQAIVIEAGGNRSASAQRLRRLHDDVLAAGLLLVRYRTTENRVHGISIDSFDARVTNNLLYVRDPGWINRRLAKCRTFFIQGSKL